ncbi:hypothetical protein [Sphingobium lignivorans]|uniref:Uncharacterized protein n=1 Tax=Sphingobium lignivorans TaxID=2735886 RepID=A0ABR6NL68_9SPHN|nr:hypothetical protein [Sphingobium lignivorans]MBB5987412.1 hypothetical protein [Sphingobium lignivorans]
MTLANAIARMERVLIDHGKATANLRADTDYDAWWSARKAVDKMSTDALTSAGAAVTSDWRGAAIRLAGVRSTSTCGLRGAMTNWLRLARDRHARQQLEDFGKAD